MKNKVTLFLSLLVMSYSIFAAADDIAVNLDAETSNQTQLTYSIRLLDENEKKDFQYLISFCTDHAKHIQTSNERDFSALTFQKIIKSMKSVTFLKTSEHQLDPIFGVYGFFANQSDKEELVGIIKMVGDSSNHNGVEGYAECEMTMHPSYRGKGLGPCFRMQFHDQIIVPILQTARKFVDKSSVFQGTIGYIHAYNAPSRRMVAKLGFVPVRFTTKPYFAGQEALQIMYIFPPLSPDYNLPAPLSADLVQVIQNNNLTENPTIPIRYLNQEPLINECLEEARKYRQKTLEDTPIRFVSLVPSLSKYFSKILEGFIPSFLEKASGQPLLQLAQEIALLENIKQVAEKHELLDEEILTFLQKQDIESKRHIFQEMMLSS